MRYAKKKDNKGILLLSVSSHSIAKFPAHNGDGEGDVYPFRVERIVSQAKRIRFAHGRYSLPLDALSRGSGDGMEWAELGGCGAG